MKTTYIILILILMWLILMGFFYLKADEVTKDPCSICSDKMGKDIFCQYKTGGSITRTYYPNGTIIDDVSASFLP